MLCHEIERSASPEEAVVVDDRLLGWGLRRLGSMELRRKIRFVAADRDGGSLLPMAALGGGELLLVTGEGDPLLGRLRSGGWKVREATFGRPTFQLGHGPILVFFVVQP
jgi:hypothetical protein